MEKLFKTIILGIVLMLVPVFAMAGSMTGSIQGYNCVTKGLVCPIGQEDPIAATESVFVLLVDASDDEYYFVPNVDRAVLARHLNTQVTIDGAVDKKWKSIQATDIEKNGKKVWSSDMQDEVNRIYGGQR